MRRSNYFFLILVLIFLCGLTPVKFWFQNPKKGMYSGYPDGVNVLYHRNRNPKERFIIKNKELHGEFFSYYKNGLVHVYENFKTGHLQGKRIVLSPSGDTLVFEHYRNDTLLDHHAYEYYPITRHLKSIKNYNFGKAGAGINPFINRTSGHVIENFNIENIATTTSNVYTYREFYPSGKMKTFGRGKNGRYEGLYTEYHPNGQKSLDAECKAGRYNGSYKEYDKDGFIKVSAACKDDKFVGPHLTYDKSGKVIKTKSFGKQNGN